jgi:UDP-arabinose 4-epimerase
VRRARGIGVLIVRTAIASIIENTQMTPILVTGGAGYIGSHACKCLAAAGYLPVTYDSLVTGNRWAVQWGPFEHGDLHDRERLTEVLRRHRPTAVIHFAASAYVGESVTDPAKYYRNNVAGTLSLLEALRLNDIGKLVFSSTCASYGIPASVPICETAPQVPINAYGRSKLMIEHMLADYAAAYSLHAVALRYFNACGADPDGAIGENHDPETHLVPLVLAAAAGTGNPVTVFGTDYPTPDGTCIRDYTHVSDLASAHVLALERALGGPGFQAFNLGTGAGFSVAEVITAAGRITGRKVPFTTGHRRAGDPAALVADPARARDILGWRPQHSDLETVLSTAWRWMQRNAS